MDQQEQTQQVQQTIIQLTLTVAEVNSLIQGLHKAPYEISQPLIETVTKQAQDFLSRAAQQAPAVEPAAQMPSGMLNQTSNYGTPSSG